MLDLDNLQPILVPDDDFIYNWKMALKQPVGYTSAAYVVGIRRTNKYEDLRVIVRVIDELGLPIPDVPVVFSYDTAKPFDVPSGMAWAPPAFVGDLVHTKMDGTIDHVQGSAIKKGKPGGITVFLLEPTIPSTIVSGAGMLADHTGVVITYQFRRNGIDVSSLKTKLEGLEKRLTNLEN